MKHKQRVKKSPVPLPQPSFVQIIVIEPTQAIRVPLMRNLCHNRIAGARVSLKYSLSDVLSDPERLNAAKVIVLGIHIGTKPDEATAICQRLTAENNQAQIVLFAPRLFDPGKHRKITRPNIQELIDTLSTIVQEQPPPATTN